jgi:hypothetical protein
MDSNRGNINMSEQNIPIEAYQTFVTSKPFEWDAFVRQWWVDHPVVEVAPVEVAVSKRRKTVVDVPIVDDSADV